MYTCSTHLYVVVEPLLNTYIHQSAAVATQCPPNPNITYSFGANTAGKNSRGNSSINQHLSIPAGDPSPATTCRAVRSTPDLYTQNRVIVRYAHTT